MTDYVKCTRKWPPSWGPNSLIVVVVNDSFPLNLRVLLLDHDGLIARLALVNDGSSVMITIVVMAGANRHASSNRSDAHTDTHIFRKCGGAKTKGGNSSNTKSFLHGHPPIE